MKHTAVLKTLNHSNNGKSALVRATGKFYTPYKMVEDLVDSVWAKANLMPGKLYRLIDPFCGDGRLICAFLEGLQKKGIELEIEWEISIWDYDEKAVKLAHRNIQSIIEKLKLKASVKPFCHDSFLVLPNCFGAYDIVLTNPPWETIKPDRRELEGLSSSARKRYLSEIRQYDLRLAVALPNSQPRRKYAGWGTNLSRCGLELALKLTASDGICGIVTPLSLLMDQVSSDLRLWMLEVATPLEISYYPAETKLFDLVDQETVIITFKKSHSNAFTVRITAYNRSAEVASINKLRLTKKELEETDYCIPVNVSPVLQKIMRKWETLPKVRDLEKRPSTFWLGRELDETRYNEFVSDTGEYPFVKGRMIERFRFIEKPTLYVIESKREIPISSHFYRIAWRDVSRRSQSRRMQAAIIPPQFVTGNSLHVGFYKDDDLARLRALTAIFNSIPFEFQVRSRSGTGHISLGIVKEIRIPVLSSRDVIAQLATLVAKLEEKSDQDLELRAEILVAKLYNLSRDEYKKLLEHFGNLPDGVAERLLVHSAWQDNIDGSQKNQLLSLQKNKEERQNQNSKKTMDTVFKIPNHYTATLSELDLQMALAVPPGGNWKNIPESIPSKRLEQIRTSYKNGGGSRSTYYGRLHPDRPAYTISTNFHRPGNGCHLHYDYEGGQHRVISQREAARLQSFPDNFIFYGNRSSVNNQIGNAVPPLLAYQIAKTIPFRGKVVDLFSGAGGLSLGFKWAGWEPIVANDVDGSFLETYRHNIHENVVEGDIRKQEIFDQVVQNVREVRAKDPKTPIIVLGGPPCQGFSTAGNRRSMDDDRNKLFYEYKAMLLAIKPEAFVFENVPGLLSMENGKVFEMIKAELASTVSKLEHWTLQAEQYAVPQRRTRILLVGLSTPGFALEKPHPVTRFGSQDLLFDPSPHIIGVRDALSDLPPLQSGEDGSYKDYVSEPKNFYQMLMRSELNVQEYLQLIKESTQAEITDSSPLYLS